MEIFTYINIFIAGWISCQFFIAWKLRRALKKIADEHGLTLEELSETMSDDSNLPKNIIRVPNYFTENTSNSILLYNKDTGDFVSQAYTIDELADNVYKFNKVKFAYVAHGDTKCWFVEGKVKDNLKEIE